MKLITNVYGAGRSLVVVVDFPVDCVGRFAAPTPRDEERRVPFHLDHRIELVGYQHPEAANFNLILVKMVSDLGNTSPEANEH